MNTSRKAKIVVKIADNKSEVAFIKSLFDAGADVAWLNTAHQDEPATLEVMKKIRQVSTKIPIMIDTKGPEIRLKDIEVPFEIKAGDSLTFTGNESLSGKGIVHVSYKNFHNEVPVGASVLYDDASIEFVVEEKVTNGIRCVSKSSGTIKNKKSLNIPSVHIHLPALSEKDKSFIHFCAKNSVDFIAHSFVRNKADIAEIRAILAGYPEYTGKIISKVENREGFDNIADILAHSDGLMVARGDLGAEVPIEELPFMQKKMVEAALSSGKYCIVATQVLESMIKNPRPTRAEITDIANAVLDGTSGVSMSGETAYGEYPIEAVTTMGRIMKYTEDKRAELVHFTEAPKAKTAAQKNASKLINKADKAKAKAIIVLSKDLAISRAIAACRPSAVIVPVLQSEIDFREIVMAYGTRPVMSAELSASVAHAHVKAMDIKDSDVVAVIEEKKAGSYSFKTMKLKEVK